MPIASALLAAVVIAQVASPPAPAPLASEPKGALEIDSEVKVRIEGIAGQISVIGDDQSTVRFSSEEKDGGAPADVAVYDDGREIRLAPPPGGPPPAARGLVVWMPRRMSVALATDGSTVSLEGIAGASEVRGKEIALSTQDLAGSLDAEFQGGRAEIRGGSGDLTLRLANVDVTVGSTHGSVYGNLSGGTFSAQALGKSLDLHGNKTAFAISSTVTDVHIVATGGTVALEKVAGTHDLELTASRLRVNQVRGDLTVTSDTDVQFAACEAGFHLDLYGGSLRGDGNQGMLEARTHNATIGLAHMQGPLRLEGDGLKVQLTDVTGDVAIDASLSSIHLDRIAGALNVSDDRGDLSVSRVSGSVDAHVVGGDMGVTGVTGRVNAFVEQGNLTASWTSIGGNADSYLHCPDGDVTLTVPNAPSCRIEATSRYGRIDTNYPRVRVSADASSAQGACMRAGTPLIRIDAGGDVHILHTGGRRRRPGTF